MTAVDDVSTALPLAANRPPLDVRDGPLLDRNQNDVALRHHGGASLSGARTGRAAPFDRERELTVTSALRLPQSSVLTSSWPETPPGPTPSPARPAAAAAPA